jgi:hypothetical protein
MELGLILGLVLFVFGVVLTLLSYQGWYINWIKERIPMERNKLIRAERVSGVALSIIGLLQTMKVMILFLAGLIVSGLLLITSLFLSDPKIVMYLLLIIGIIPIAISGLMSGAFVSGDRVRANYSDSQDFIERTNIGSKFFLFGLPCLVVGIAISFIR